MVLSIIPSTVGESGSAGSARGEVFEIGKDRQELPPQSSGFFLPFMKHEYTTIGSHGLFVFRASLLQQYGLDSAGKITQISVLNMWGGQTYNHPTAGAQFSPGVSRFLNFKVKMGMTVRPTPSGTFNANYDVAGPVTVYDYPGWVTIQGTHMNWIDCPLTTPFNYDGVSHLVIEYEWDDISGYDFCSAHGGLWTAAGYTNLKGNILTGFFRNLGYSTIVWNPNANSATGIVLGIGNDILPVLQIEGEFAIPATMRMEPQSLNLESNGNFVNVKVLSFPENPEYSPLDVTQGSVVVEGINCELKHGTWNDNKYLTKCDRLLLEDVIGAPSEDTELEIVGGLNDGRTFKGMAVIDTHVHTP
jgi:hypothetical protein